MATVVSGAWYPVDNRRVEVRKAAIDAAAGTAGGCAGQPTSKWALSRIFGFIS